MKRLPYVEALTITLIAFSLYAFVHIFHISPKSICSMTWSRPNYLDVTSNIPNSDELTSFPATYRMYYHFQGYDYGKKGQISGSDLVKQSKKQSSKNIVILYIHGQGGSHEQIRSIGQRILFHNHVLNQEKTKNYFISFLTFDFGEEWSALSLNAIQRQRNFVYFMISKYLYHSNNNWYLNTADRAKYRWSTFNQFEIDTKNNTRFIFLSHSMGGVVTLSLFEKLMKNNNQPFDQLFLSNIISMIFVSSPLQHPVFRFGNVCLFLFCNFNTFFFPISSQSHVAVVFFRLVSFVQDNFGKWYKNKLQCRIFNAVIEKLGKNNVISLSGSSQDRMIEPILSYYNKNNSNRIVNVNSQTNNGILRCIDHQATVWCHDMVEIISWYIVNSVLKNKTNSYELYKPPLYSNKLSDWNYNNNNHKQKDKFTINEQFIDWSADSQPTNGLVFPALKQIPLNIDTTHTSSSSSSSSSAAPASNIILICNEPIEQFDICSQLGTICDNYENHINNQIGAKIMKVSGSYDYTFATTTDTYIPRFVAMINSNELNKLPSHSKNKIFLEIVLSDSRGEYHKYPSMCSVWHGFSSNLKVNTNNVNNLYQINVPSMAGHFVHSINMPGNMFHDISIRLSMKQQQEQQQKAKRGKYICVNGLSGINIAAINGIYHGKKNKKTGEIYYEQDLGFWYSPIWKMAEYTKQQTKKLYLYKHKKRNFWSFGTKLNGESISAHCEIATQTPFECQDWRVFESQVKMWRQRTKFNFQSCNPHDLSLLHMSSSNKNEIINEWISVPSMDNGDVSYEYRTIMARVQTVTDDYFENNINFEWFISSDNSGDKNTLMYNVEIEYNIISSIIKTMMHDIFYFANIFCLCLFGSLFCLLLLSLFSLKPQKLLLFVLLGLVFPSSCLCGVIMFPDQVFVDSPLSMHWRVWYETRNDTQVSLWLNLISCLLPFLYIWICFSWILFVYECLSTLCSYLSKYVCNRLSHVSTVLLVFLCSGSIITILVCFLISCVCKVLFK